MSEQAPNLTPPLEHPDSIPNNYALEALDSGLITAESRVNHVTTPAEIANQEFMDGIHEKQRGIGYTETELAGKPFIIAERLPSKGQSSTGPEVPGNNDASSGETPPNDVIDDVVDGGDGGGAANGGNTARGREDANGGGNEHLRKLYSRADQVLWAPDENGESQVGLEFRWPEREKVRVGNQQFMQEGVIPWQHPYMNGPNRQIIMRGFDRENNSHYTGYIKGYKLYEITSINGGKPSIKVSELPIDTQMPDMSIGRKFAGNFDLSMVEVKAPDSVRKVPYDANRRWDTYKPRGEDPFTKLDRMLGEEPQPGQVDANPDWVAPDGGNGHEPPTEELPAGNGSPESGGNTDNPLERMAEFSERFKDKTYVPTLEEYAQMREAASHIHIDYGDEEGKSPIRYLDDNGSQLNPTETRAFLDKVNPGEWMLKDKEAEIADDLYEHATPINIDRLDLPQRTRRDWLSYKQFAEERRPADGEAGPSREQLVQQYKEYLGRRVELSDSFTHRQEEEGDQAAEVITPEDIAVGAIRSFRLGLTQQAFERKRRNEARLRNARPDRLARRAASRIRRGRS